MSKFLRVRSTHALSFVIMLIALLCQPLSLVAQSSPDFDGDGTVDVSDFLFFVDLFGSKEGEERYDAQYDLDGDGEIGIGDFLIFVDSFGKAANSVPEAVNSVPIFTSEPPVTRSVDENTPSGQPIGEPISATDGDDDTLTYRLSGADANSFAIDASTGQISTQGTYDFEQKSSYSVTVIVSDGEGGEASLVVNITINDIEEPSATVPSNVVVEDGDSKLTVRWDAVLDEEGKPSVTGYEVRHRERDADDSVEWAVGEPTSSRLNTSVTITGLLNGQAYQVSVRTLVDGGMSAWSSPVLGIPVIPAAGPVFPGGGGGTSTPRIPPTPPTPPTPPPNNGLGSGASETEQQTAVFVTGPEEGSEEEPVIAQQQGTNTTDTVSDDINTTGTINVGDSWIDRTPVVGTIDYQDDADWYRTVLEAAHCYQIDIRGKDSWEYYQSHPDHAPNVELTLTDPFLGGIYSVRGEYFPRTEADYGGVGRDAVKTVRFNGGGTFYIAVTRTKLGNDGTYDLSLIDLGTVTRTCTEIRVRGPGSEPVGGDLPNDQTTTGYVIPDGAPASGEISPQRDIDYFKVDLVAGQSYQIDLKGNVPTDYGGTLGNPALVLLGRSGPNDYLDPDTDPDVTARNFDSFYALPPGTGIANDNSYSRSGVFNSRLEIDVHTTGTYFILVHSRSRSSGTYTLIVTTE